MKFHFNSPTSQKNIKDNQIHLSGKQTSLIQDYWKTLFEVLVFSVIVTTNQDEAFTFFDTQNNRGIKLSAVDFLKSYHLRELKSAEDKQRIFAKKWDKNNQGQFLNTLFCNIIWRSRKWKGKNIHYENTDFILKEFQKNAIKGNENGAISLYSGSKNRLAKALNFDTKLGITIETNSILIQAKALDYPFSLRQPIEKGTAFFLFTEKYSDLYHYLFLTEHLADTEIGKMRNFYKIVYDGSNLSSYLKELFRLCVTVYYDSFEENKLYDFSLWLDYLIGSYRIGQSSIVAQTSVKILRDISNNLLDIIIGAYRPEEVLNFLQENTNDNIYVNEIIALKNEYNNDKYGVRERYKRAVLTYFNKIQNTHNLNDRKNWNI